MHGTPSRFTLGHYSQSEHRNNWNSWRRFCFQEFGDIESLQWQDIGQGNDQIRRNKEGVPSTWSREGVIGVTGDMVLQHHRQTPQIRHRPPISLALLHNIRTMWWDIA